ncbi:MAG: hypothetical protein QOI41_727 [Myxococcales bacterium]|nr:hypothetical protein [Myxococcales bacterium]
MSHIVVRRSAVVVLAVALVAAVPSCDPVHDDAVAALGPEAPGVRMGPLHRPGQPCRTCHDGSAGNPPEFSVAGTVFVNENDTTAASGVGVTLTSANGASFTATTNAAGNFFVRPDEFTPAYPMGVLLIASSTAVRMSTLIGRDGSCATCHHDPAGPTSPGRVFLPANGVTP